MALVELVSPERAEPSRRGPCARASKLELLEIELLLEAVYRHYGHDFRAYAFSSLHRRLKRCLERERLPTYSALQNRVLHDVAAMRRMLGALSVPVTGMFRDPAFFAALRRKVVPMLRARPHIRVWHAGCATGEEVYALAILLDEEGLYDRTRIYATDINVELLARARRGAFPRSRLEEYVGNYERSGGVGDVRRYFTTRYDQAIVDARLRRNILFARHDLATEGPFAEFALIMCRNVLIYFDPTLKERVLGLFEASMTSRGVLALGSRESLRCTSAHGDYEELDARERIYRRTR